MGAVSRRRKPQRRPARPLPVTDHHVTDPRELAAAIASPELAGASLLDCRNMVMLEGIEVLIVDAVRGGLLAEPTILMELSGRINKTCNDVRAGYVFGPDGAAAVITELLAVADRFGAELLDALTRRLTALHQGKHVDLAFLRAAVDNAIEQQDRT